MLSQLVSFSLKETAQECVVEGRLILKGEQEPSERSRGHQIKLRRHGFQINKRKYFFKHKDKWCKSSPQDIADAQSLHESRRKLYFLVGEKSIEDY